MRYQLRLLDQNLPGLAREISLACWHAANGVLKESLGKGLYRELYRGVKEVFTRHVEAFRYCNAAPVCERSVPQVVMRMLPRHENFAGEHVHLYLMNAESPPEKIVREIVTKSVRSIAAFFPGVHLHGLASALHRATEKALAGRILPSRNCGDDVLCHANEAYDPWDLRDPINLVRIAQ